MAAGTPLATQIPRFFSSISIPQLDSSLLRNGFHATTSYRRISLVRASKEPQDKAPFLSQEDLVYMVKLGAGSVAGAAAIKYGSIIFPEITRPNLGLALLMIFAPVVFAVLILIKQAESIKKRNRFLKRSQDFSRKK